MIKNLFIIILVFCFTFGGAGLMGEESLDDDTFCDCNAANVVWCWEINADSETITSSGGCADAGWGTVASPTGTVDIASAPAGKTGYAIYFADASDYYTITTPSGMDTEGTVQFDLYVTTFLADARLFLIFGQTNQDDFRISLTSTDEIFTAHEGQNAGAVQAITTGDEIVVNTWYTITAKYRQGASNPSISIVVDEGTPATSDTDLTDWDAGDPSDTLYIGESGGINAAGYIKNIKIWDSWQ